MALQNTFFIFFQKFSKFSKIFEKKVKKVLCKASAELCRALFFTFFYFFQNFHKLFTKLHKSCTNVAQIVYACTKSVAHSSWQCQQHRTCLTTPDKEMHSISTHLDDLHLSQIIMSDDKSSRHITAKKFRNACTEWRWVEIHKFVAFCFSFDC